MKAKNKPETGSLAIRCEGWRRNGGIFTFGPVTWEQCKENGVVMLTVNQDGKTQKLPACKDCWKEVIEKKIEIVHVEPI